MTALPRTKMFYLILLVLATCGIQNDVTALSTELNPLRADSNCAPAVLYDAIRTARTLNPAVRRSEF
ncbi:hypothetical protein C0J52_13669 [Blattella germanica]|nr:hypothetical protein C0J52_13669 [Blattella germanica]